MPDACGSCSTTRVLDEEVSNTSQATAPEQRLLPLSGSSSAAAPESGSTATRALQSPQRYAQTGWS